MKHFLIASITAFALPAWGFLPKPATFLGRPAQVTLKAIFTEQPTYTENQFVDEFESNNSDREDTPPDIHQIRKVRHMLKQVVDSNSALDLIKNVIFSELHDPTEVAHQASVVKPSTSPETYSTAMAMDVEETVMQSSAETARVSSGLIDTIQEIIRILEFAENVLDNDRDLNYATYPVHKEYPNVKLSGLMKMIDGVPPLDYWFSFNKILRLAKRVLRIAFGLKLTGSRAAKAKTAEEMFKLFFTRERILWVNNPLNLVPEPKHVVEHWEEDEEFSRQFLNGVNPVMIEVVREPKKQLTPELHETLKETFKLQNLAQDGKLYMVDYRWLGELPDNHNPHQAFPLAYNPDSKLDDPRYFQVPQVVFRKDDSDGGIKVLGIQLWRNETDTNPVYTPKRDDVEWMYAKMCVAQCDSNFHEWISHLGKTHLTMEGHIMAIHNTLKKMNHPIYTFVKPMCRDTLLLNFAARDTLAKFGDNAFGDHQSSVGVGQFMQLILKYWDEYDFFKSSAFDEELEARGFDDSVELEGYYYREDGKRLWDAYGTFATEFVNEVYSSDSEVKSDDDLQAWAKETSSPKRAAIKGFPETFETRAQLAKTLKTMWWICSGLHAAVNFPQYDYYAYSPNKPMSMRASPFSFDVAKGTEKDLREWVFANAGTNLNNTSEFISTVNTLTLPSKNTIDRLDDNFQALGKVAYKRFKIVLEAIGDDINKRNIDNEKHGRAIYHYLHPKVVPASIDI